MAYGVILRFEGVGEDQYWAVNERLGIDRNGEGDYPDGILHHAGGATEDGWVVFEVWESKGAQEAFMAGKLGEALAAEQLPQPVQVIEADVVNHQATG
jgi:hypothetical protein